MTPRWRLRLLLAVALTSVLAIGWISVPLLLSSENIETKFRKFANKHGYELTFSTPPKVVMDPLPKVHLGAITLSGPEGGPVLEAADARLRPSPWMLLPGDIPAGRLEVLGTRFTLPATRVTAAHMFDQTTLDLRLGRDGSVDAGFQGQLDDQATTGQFTLSDLDALLTGRIAILGLDLEQGETRTTFEGNLRLEDAPDLAKSTPYVVGQLTIEGADLHTSGGLPGIEWLLADLSTANVTARMNLDTNRLSLLAQVVGEARGHPVRLDADVTGGPGWAETGTVEATFTTRIAGLLSAQLTGGLDWRDPLRDGIAGQTQVVALNLADLLEWSGQSDLSRLLPQPTPMSARAIGDLAWSSEGLAFAPATLFYGEREYSGEAELRLAGDRPELSVSTAVTDLFWPEIDDLLAELQAMEDPMTDLTARIEAETLSIGDISVRNADAVLRGEPSGSRLELRSGKMAGGYIYGNLSLGADGPQDVRLQLTLNSVGAEVFAPGILTGSTIGNVDARWNTAAPDLFTAAGELSVYAGQVSGLDLGAALGTTASRNGQTEFAVLSAALEAADGAVQLSPLRIFGAGWTAEGEARLALPDGTVDGRLRTIGPAGEAGRELSVSGPLHALDVAVTPDLAPVRTAPVVQPPASTSSESTAYVDGPAPATDISSDTEEIEANPDDPPEVAQIPQETEEGPARALTTTPPIPRKAPR